MALALTAPGQTAAISAFVDPIIRDLDVSRSTVSAAYMAGTLVGACAMPFFGRAIDRFGPRRTMATVGIFFGAVLVALSTVSGMVGMTFGFVGLRMGGQGALNLVATTSVAVYIEKRRGLAQGITAAVGAAGISLSPVLLEGLVADHGFRQIWLVEGLVIWALVIPLAIFGLPRRRGSDRQVDHGSDRRAGAPAGSGRAGDRPAPPTEDGSNAAASQDWTAREAIRTGMFWLVASGVCVVSLLGTAMNFHQIALLGERGLTPTEAAANFIPQTIAGLLATFAAGALSDRISDRVLIVAAMGFLVAALVLAGTVRPGWSSLTYGLALGAAGNSIRTLEATAFPNTFGLTHIGAIRGIVHTLTVTGSAFGPVLFALGHDWAGNYRSVVFAAIALPAVPIVAAAFIRAPKRRSPPPPGGPHGPEAPEGSVGIGPVDIEPADEAIPIDVATSISPADGVDGGSGGRTG